MPKIVNCGDQILVNTGNGRHFSFSYHYQGSIDFNIVNIQRTIGMNFLVFTGTRLILDDIITETILSNTLPVPLGEYKEIRPKGQYFLLHSLGRLRETHPHAGNIGNAQAVMKNGSLSMFAGRQIVTTMVIKSKLNQYNQNLIEMILM